MSVRIIIGDAREKLRELPDASVNCCVTSPPYWGAQRDYEHVAQLGHERSPEQFVACLVELFAEIRRILRPDGVCWVNIGDSYAASGKGGGGKLMLARGHKWEFRKHLKGWRSPPPGYKQKDLVGVPWMLAFALRADGWFLRSGVVWNKTSATEPTRSDRPSSSHEMLFLLSKSRRYAFDPTALPHGTVWPVKPHGYEGHSAAFPPALIEPCINAGCPLGGTVLDPFFGAGTTALVAARSGRSCIGIELNSGFAETARLRLQNDAGMFADISVEHSGPATRSAA
jgi:DNA modification methylase